MSEQDENQDQSFNDAELQDIMNEIESLEREFVEEETDTSGQSELQTQATEDETPVAEEVVEAPAAEEILETKSVETEVIETSGEQAATSEESEEEDAASLVSEVAEEYEGNVVSINEHRPTGVSEGSTASIPGQMQFSGMGNMDFNLNFPVGESHADVQVKNGKLLVSLEGVELTLSEEGCEVSMEGGVKFSVPVTSKASGKKAA